LNSTASKNTGFEPARLNLFSLVQLTLAQDRLKYPSSDKEKRSERTIDALGNFYPIDPKLEWPEIPPSPRQPPVQDKTVLFLGAGASACEVIPVQSRLLRYAMQYCSDDTSSMRLNEDWRLVLKLLRRFAPGVSVDRMQLEDCLTFLDKASELQEVIGGRGPRDLAEPRRAMLNCISQTIDAACRGRLDLEPQEVESKRDPTPMNSLGDFLRKEAKSERGKWAVVSTNWDTTLDFALLGDSPSMIDYCTYTIPWERHFKDYRGPPKTPLREVPSLWKRALNLPTIKLLKLHGSLNWLLCPTCARLYVSSTHDIGLRGLVKSGLEPPRRRYCPECLRIAGGTDRAPIMREVLVTPTMLKWLDMVHLRMIWYNALIEIAEAKRVIFAGYSAPLADFELRYMLAKAFSVRKSRPKVLVVTRNRRVSDDVDERVKQKELRELRRNYQGLLGADMELETWGIDGLVEQIVDGKLA